MSWGWERARPPHTAHCAGHGQEGGLAREDWAQLPSTSGRGGVAPDSVGEDRSQGLGRVRESCEVPGDRLGLSLGPQPGQAVPAWTPAP